MYSTWLWDLQFATRTLRKSPGVTAAVVVSVALAIAANSTVFSIVNGVLLGALPVPDPYRLINLGGGRSLSYPDYTDYRDQAADALSGVAAHFPFVPASLAGKGEPERVWGELATGNYFSVVGVPAMLGRSFTPEEDRVWGANPVVVLGHGLWRRHFGASRDVLGKRIVLNGQSYTVIGVMPPEFHGTLRGIMPEFWAPLSMYPQMLPDMGKDNIHTKRGSQWLIVDARLKPAVTREQAAAAVRVVQKRLDDTYRKGQRPNEPLKVTTAGDVPDAMNRSVIGIMTVMMVVVGIMLLIACANVANLMLARAVSRQKEIGVRLAIGAGRGRLIRQLLTESILLSGIGAAAGLMLAWAATEVIGGYQLPLPLPIRFNFTPNGRVLVFTAMLALLTGVLFGLAPALRATRPDLASSLRQEIATFGSFRRFGMRNLLVVVQVSLSLVLLVGAGLFLRSLQGASSIDLGMRPDNVLLMAMDPKLNQYSPDQTRRFLAQLRQRVAALPGVVSVSFLDSIPLSIGGTSYDFKVEGAQSSSEVNTDVYMIGSGYFETMGIPLVRGREFNARKETAGTVILNETLAHKLFPSGDPLGRRVTSDNKNYEVIGISKNFKSRTLGESPASVAFFSLEARPEDVVVFYGISIAVHTASHAERLVRPLRHEVALLDPNLAVFNIETMREHVDKALLLPRLSGVLLGVFGAVGLILAIVGLYGVMNYSVRGRTREIGIRMALGAPSATVLRMVTGQGMLLVSIGLAIGLVLALALSRFAASLLYGVSATDKLTFVGVPCVLLVVASIAVLLPARRAARIDPLAALRHE